MPVSTFTCALTVRLSFFATREKRRASSMVDSVGIT